MGYLCRTRRIIGILVITACVAVLSACPPVLGSEDEQPPGEVIDITATAGDGTVVLSWFNPEDSDFNTCLLTYGPENGEQTDFTGLIDSTGTVITGLENGTVYTFTLKTADFKGNVSAGVTVDSIPFEGADDPVPVSGIVIDTGELNLQTGGASQLSAAIQPADATDFRYEWISSDETVATVDGDGIVRAVGEGSALILAVTREGSFSDYCTVTVTAAPIVRVTGVSVSPDTVEITVGEDYQLTAEIQPANATNQIVYWSGDDPAIASVSDGGLVTGVAAGSTAVRVTTDDGGFVAAAAITVNEASSVAAPSGLTAIMTNHTEGTYSSQVDLTWSDNSENETGFEIQRRYTPQGGSAGTWTDVVGGTASAGTGTLTESDTGVDLRNMVEYRIRAVSGATPSDWSNTAVVVDQYEDGDDIENYHVTYGWNNQWRDHTNYPVGDDDWIAIDDYWGSGQRAYAIYIDNYSGGDNTSLELISDAGYIDFTDSGDDGIPLETVTAEAVNLFSGGYVNTRDTLPEDAKMVVLGDNSLYNFKFSNELLGPYRFKLVYCGDRYEASEYGNDSSTDYYWSGEQITIDSGNPSGSLTFSGFTLHDEMDEDWTAFYLDTYGTSDPVTVEIWCPEGIPGGGTITVVGSSYGEFVPQENTDFVSFTFPAGDFDTILIGVGGNWEAGGGATEYSLEIYVHEVW